MPRATDISVSAIIEVDSSISLTPFIAIANELVTELCGDVGYSDTRLAQIETWLAAHFYAIHDPRAQSESAGPVSQSIESRVDLGLNVTRYGQQAMRLDTKGALSRLEKQIKDGTKGRSVGTLWLGTAYE